MFSNLFVVIDVQFDDKHVRVRAILIITY